LISLLEECKVSILRIFSHPVWRVETSEAALVHLLEWVWCEKYTRLCILVACCTGFDAVCGIRCSGVCLSSVCSRLQPATHTRKADAEPVILFASYSLL